MKKLTKTIILVVVLLCSLNKTLSYYHTNTTLINWFNTKGYNLDINSSGGIFKEEKIIVKDNKVILPIPQKHGYEFLNYVDDSNINYNAGITNIDEINNKNLTANWLAISYFIYYNLNGGKISESDIINSYSIEDKITLPTPKREGYTFKGWTGTGLNSITKIVRINNETGDRSYTANWVKNYYTVNYYVNDKLWEQRSVGYNDNLENLNAQSILDGYHKFNHWDGWISKMPDHDINLYANITETYCKLRTGHGEYANASGILNVFKNAGWNGSIQEAYGYRGKYLVETDYTLTRSQAEEQKNYIASHTNYNNYNYPFLYWVNISCTNGYSQDWTRSLGQSNFN